MGYRWGLSIIYCPHRAREKGFCYLFQGLGIPIVTLLLEGGIDAIRIIKERLKEGIAAVIIEGSGRAADIIAYAYRNATKIS